MRYALRRLSLGLAVTTFFTSGLRADDGPKLPEPPALPRLADAPLADLKLGSIKAPTLDQARAMAKKHADSRWTTVEALWTPAQGRTLLDRTVDTFSALDPAVAQFVQAVRVQPSTGQLDSPVLKDEKQPAYVRNNLKLFLARALTAKRLHEDGLALFRSLTPETLVDPGTYYFYRAVCENKLRLKDDGLLSTHRLLTSMQNDAPERYVVVAGLMQDEMLKWEDQDLGDVARRMEEIEARLDNARGGPKTIEKQKEVVSLLDKIIKEMEDQCNKCNNCSGGGQAKAQAPAGDSRIMNGAGQGEVENKKIVATAEVWGKMPEKEKVKALEAVNRQLPAHVREAAEGFSKKLQTGGK